jgi:tRNA (Thr-GGU) A37 N-methylase
VGIFAVRKRSHPNPIGLAVVELLGRRRNVLKVMGLDAINRTPIIDIKSFDLEDSPDNMSAKMMVWQER